MTSNTTMSSQSEMIPLVPDWVPEAARTYLAHTETGFGMRELARRHALHASTVLRHVRRFENRRDDPLVDEALAALGGAITPKDSPQDGFQMNEFSHVARVALDDEIETEARRILRRLCEAAAFLIVVPSLEKAAVMRETSQGTQVRIAVLDRHIAQAFALKDWIECFKKGKVSRYRITGAGRAALKRILARCEPRDPSEQGFAEVASPFREQHAEWETRGNTANGRRRLKYNLGESPITALGRRLDRQGNPFLSSQQVQAGERLREDFEMAQMGPNITQNWDRFLTAGQRGISGGHGPSEGSGAARARVLDALGALGPGLGDIALRCCCYLEGLEAAEKRMGWSARSGKIVLRIALERLRRHYEETHGTLSPLIG